MTEAKTETKVITPTIFTLIANAKDRIGVVKKGDRNQAQNFSFRGIDAVVNAISPVFNDLGIITVPKVLEHEYETVTIGKNNTQMGHVSLVVEYTFYGPEGDSIAAVVASEAMDSGDKGTSKAMSVAYRTALLQVLNLPTDEPDPDAASYERSAPKKGDAETAWDYVIGKTVTLEDLRKVWKDAGASGALKREVVSAEGEKMTVQEMLYKRSDELSFRESPAESSANGKN